MVAERHLNSDAEGNRKPLHNDSKKYYYGKERTGASSRQPLNKQRVLKFSRLEIVKSKINIGTWNSLSEEGKLDNLKEEVERLRWSGQEHASEVFSAVTIKTITTETELENS